MTSLSSQDDRAVINHGSHATNGSGSLDRVPHKFTWKELSKLNEPHNAHVAYRGKVSCTESTIVSVVRRTDGDRECVCIIRTISKFIIIHIVW